MASQQAGNCQRLVQKRFQPTFPEYGKASVRRMRNVVIAILLHTFEMLVR